MFIFSTSYNSSKNNYSIWWKNFGLLDSILFKNFLSVKIEVKGLENIPRNKNFFIASLHQSLFETFFLQTIFKNPVFILKNNCLKYLYLAGN